MTEVVRVLKKGGIMKIEGPYWKSEERLLCINPRYWDALHHVRMFRDGEMEELMSRHGLERIDYKRIKFFDNILLGYYLKRGDIINQRGVVGGITPLQHFLCKLIYGIPYIIYKISSKYWDNKFPKSIYFEFKKV